MAQDAVAAEPAFMEVRTARMGTLGDCSVGLRSVEDDPLNAEIVVSGTTDGTEWEAAQVVVPGQQVIAAQARYRVASMSAKAGGTPAVVRFTADGTGPDVLVLAAAGRLRLDGPSIDTATDARVLQWEPDAAHPVAAEVEWWPAHWGRDNTDPADVQQARLAVGSRAVIGKRALEVVAVEGAGAEHPARVTLVLR